MGLFLIRVLLIYLVYLGIKSLLNKFLGPVEQDKEKANKIYRKKHHSKHTKENDDAIEADYKVIK